MNKFVPIEKRSKREQRELNARRRGSWNGVNPVTRVPMNSKAYRRANAGNWRSSLRDPASFFALAPPCKAVKPTF